MRHLVYSGHGGNRLTADGCTVKEQARAGLLRDDLSETELSEFIRRRQSRVVAARAVSRDIREHQVLDSVSAVRFAVTLQRPRDRNTLVRGENAGIGAPNMALAFGMDRFMNQK